MNSKGFTLIELIIVIAIVGILTAIALPTYQRQVQDTRRSDAQSVLVEAAGALERFFTENNSYADAELGSDPGDVFPDESPLDGGRKFYTITLISIDIAYTLTATPRVGTGQVGNGNLTLNSRGQKTWDENNDTAISATENDWIRN